MNDPLYILAVGILIVVGGIIVLRLHAFLSLLLGAMIVAILTPETSIVAFAIAKGMSADAATRCRTGYHDPVTQPLVTEHTETVSIHDA